MVPLTSDPDFKVTTFLTLNNISEMTWEWYSQSYYRTSIGSHMRSIERWHLQWPWRTLTRFSRSRHFWCRISQKHVEYLKNGAFYGQSFYRTLL